MKSPQTATTTLGDYEIALQAYETRERMILIESTEEDHLKNFFFFEIQGDLLQRAVTVGILRGLIGSLCLFQSDIEAMGRAIQEEFASLSEQGDMKPIDSFIILQIDSRNGISYCGESWPPPLLPNARPDDLIAGLNSIESRELKKGVVDLKEQEACYLIPGVKNDGNPLLSDSLNRLLQTILQPSGESPLKLIEIATNALNWNPSSGDVSLLLPTACIKRVPKK